MSDINYRFITAINELLGITTKIKWSMDYDINVNGSTEKLIQIYNQTSANTYLSGPIAKEYLDIELFERKRAFFPR